MSEDTQQVLIVCAAIVLVILGVVGAIAGYSGYKVTQCAKMQPQVAIELCTNGG